MIQALSEHAQCRQQEKNGGEIDPSTARLSVITHSFGGVITRAALNSSMWRRGWGGGGRVRCVLFAPPNRGSSLARSIIPENWEHRYRDWDGWDTAKMALGAITKTLLGEKAGIQLAQVQDSRFEEQFGSFPMAAEVLVVAGDCGEINPLISENPYLSV